MAVSLSDPFGGDDVDFPVSQYTQSMLDNAKAGSEVSSAVRNHFQVALTDLSSDILKFCHRQTMQLIGMR